MSCVAVFFKGRGVKDEANGLGVVAGVATGVAMAWDEGELRGLRVFLGAGGGGGEGEGLGPVKLLTGAVIGGSLGPIEPLGIFGMHRPACRYVPGGHCLLRCIIGL